MHREGRIYLGYAIVGGALTAYVVDKLLVLIQRALSPTDIAMLAVAAIILFTLSSLYAVLAFVFAARFIDRLRSEDNSIVLCPRKGAPIRVNGVVRILRRFGKQFSFEENKPTFVLFVANGQLWVRPEENARHGV
jgi:hypothetical protein